MSLTFEDYKKMLLRGENLPKVKEGICPLCLTPFSYPRRMCSACAQCSRQLRRWKSRIYRSSEFKAKRHADKLADLAAASRADKRREMWTVRTCDGYYYEPSPNLGF